MKQILRTPFPIDAGRNNVYLVVDYALETIKPTQIDFHASL